MNKFDIFTKKLLANKGLNDTDYIELNEYIKDKLYIMKNEFIEDGKSEEESIDLAINYFQKKDFNIKDIINELPYKNKVVNLSIYRKINVSLLNLLIYLSLNIYVFINNNDKVRSPITFLITLLLTMLIPYIYVMRNTYNHDFRIKNLLSIYIIYFIFEKSTSLAFALLLGNTRLYILHNSYNMYYIISQIIMAIFMIYMTKIKIYLSVKSDKKIYWFNTRYIFLTIISLFMMLFFFTVFNNDYYLNRAIRKTLFITESNILFVELNNQYFIPNIGLCLLLIIFLRLIYNYKKNYTIKNKL